jgi:predicted outer membrane protein
MRQALALLSLLMLSPAAQAATCTIEDHPTCTITCPAGCIATWVEIGGCATSCSPAAAEGKNAKIVIQNATPRELRDFIKSKKFKRLFEPK